MVWPLAAKLAIRKNIQKQDASELSECMSQPCWTVTELLVLNYICLHKIHYLHHSLMAPMVKYPLAMREAWVWSLGWEDPLEEGLATHSSIFAWKIPIDRGAWWATVHGILQARILEWVAFPFSKGSSQPRDQTQASRIAGRLFTSWICLQFRKHWFDSWVGKIC